MNTQTLTESRIQLHYAIQYMAAIGANLVPPQMDYSHTALAWHPAWKSFTSQLIPAPIPFQVALEPVQLISLILDGQGQPLATLPLHGKTLDEGFVWLRTEVAKLGADADLVLPLSYPPEGFPDHPLAHGATFNAEPADGRQQLISYYGETATLLETSVLGISGASPIRIWPHHFDMASLITLPGKKDGEVPSIGVGLSPGDDGYHEPYWYITPWPYPDPKYLLPLTGGGSWHTENWVGAILRASQLEAGHHQTEQLKMFFDSAIAACRSLF